MEKKELYTKVIRQFGGVTQKIHLMEECAELIAALTRNSLALENNIEEETADVYIMLEQLSLIEEYKLPKLNSEDIPIRLTTTLTNKIILSLSELIQLISKNIREDKQIEELKVDDAWFYVQILQGMFPKEVGYYKKAKLKRMKELVKDE